MWEAFVFSPPILLSKKNSLSPSAAGAQWLYLFPWLTGEVLQISLVLGALLHSIHNVSYSSRNFLLALLLILIFFFTQGWTLLHLACGLYSTLDSPLLVRYIAESLTVSHRRVSVSNGFKWWVTLDAARFVCLLLRFCVWGAGNTTPLSIPATHKRCKLCILKLSCILLTSIA